jgi:hypothetical protein
VPGIAVVMASPDARSPGSGPATWALTRRDPLVLARRDPLRDHKIQVAEAWSILGALSRFELHFLAPYRRRWRRDRDPARGQGRGGAPKLGGRPDGRRRPRRGACPVPRRAASRCPAGRLPGGGRLRRGPRGSSPPLRSRSMVTIPPRSASFPDGWKRRHVDHVKAAAEARGSSRRWWLRASGGVSRLGAGCSRTQELVGCLQRSSTEPSLWGRDGSMLAAAWPTAAR